MKKTTIILMVALFGGSLALSAQQPDSKKKTLGEKVGRFLDKTKTNLENAGHDLGDAIGFEDRIEGKSDLLKVNGAFYMPLYEKNLYTGDSAQSYRNACITIFKKKYPMTEIQTVAIPQTDWVLKTIENDAGIVGYEQTLFCYIIAKDGKEGYINAKFIFSQYKNVGQSYMRVKDSWPKWERTDILTNSVYNQLLNQ